MLLRRRDLMKFKAMMVVKTLICIGFGIPMVVIPGRLMSVFGVALTVGGIFLARLYGATLLGNFMLTWLGRKITAPDARRAISVHLVVYDAIGFVVALLATLSGVMNVLGWAVVAIYFFVTLGFGAFLAKPSAA
jgi:hypothetical protein